MFAKFTDRAAKIMARTNQEAQRFHHKYVGTEHLLLALAKEDNGVAVTALRNLGLDLARVVR
jgi:ATP-dependent Clp protease ATP-binding subunit ClpC